MDGRIELWWVPDPERATHARFVVRDHGAPFRPESPPGNDFHDRSTWRRGRGFGLDIIHRAMERVQYHPGQPSGNITLLGYELAAVTNAEEPESHG
jgi:hypothetical protein